MRKLTLREVKYIAQGHIASKVCQISHAVPNISGSALWVAGGRIFSPGPQIQSSSAQIHSLKKKEKNRVFAM